MVHPAYIPCFRAIRDNAEHLTKLGRRFARRPKGDIAPWLIRTSSLRTTRMYRSKGTVDAAKCMHHTQSHGARGRSRQGLGCIRNGTGRLAHQCKIHMSYCDLARRSRAPGVPHASRPHRASRRSQGQRIEFSCEDRARGASPLRGAVVGGRRFFSRVNRNFKAMCSSRRGFCARVCDSPWRRSLPDVRIT